MFLNKLKYQKPLFHSSLLWIGFFISSLLIGLFFYNIVYKELFLILSFIFISINASLFFNFLTPFFYSKKYEAEGINKFTIYERCDFITISFSGELLHNEFFPSFFKGYIIKILEEEKNPSNRFIIREHYNSDIVSEFFILNYRVKNLKNIEKVYKKFNVKNKISDF